MSDLPDPIAAARGILKPDTDHFDLMNSGYLTYSLTSAVSDLSDLASKGEAEREALRMDAPALIEAALRIQNLIEYLNIRRAA